MSDTTTVLPLPKLKYGNTKVETIMYNGNEIFDIVEQTADGSSKSIYHKHQGTEKKEGGCHTVKKTKRVSTEHIWKIAESLPETIHNAPLGEDDFLTSYRAYNYKIKDQHGHEAQVSYVWHSSEGRKMLGNWSMSGMSNYSDRAASNSGMIEGNSLGNPEHGTNNKGPWGGAASYTTTKTTTTTYYDLGCGFDES